MKNIFLLSIVLLFFSCKISFFKKNKPVQTKYREKNPIEKLRIESLNGDIDLIGWSNNLIEIETNAMITSGFKNDINLLDTEFIKTGNELNITTKIPERVKGIINLKIYIPYMLLKIYINSQKGNINITKYLGDLEINQSRGNNNINFYGNILRLESDKTKINLNIKSFNSSDIIIINKEGNTKIKIDEIGQSSFMDIKSINGDIDLSISDHISCQFSVINQNRININFEYDEVSSLKNKYNFIIGTKLKNINKCLFEISNLNGRINIKDFKKQKNILF
jgi:DUF4097 and DUF4098 domain-containing protein YvlB